MKRIFVIAAFLMTALLLSGCMNLTMDLTFNPDGSGKVYFDIGMSEGFLAMGESSGDGFSLDALSEDLTETENTRNPQVTEYVSEDGYQHRVFEADVVDMHAFMMDLQASNDESMQWTYEALDNGNVLIRMVMGVGSEAGSDMDAIGMGLISEAIKGQYFTVRLHTPNMVETNGVWNARSKTAEWQVPLADIMTERVEIRHEYTPGGGFPWLLVGGIAALLVVAVGVLIVVVVLVRRNAEPSA